MGFSLRNHPATEAVAACQVAPGERWPGWHACGLAELGAVFHGISWDFMETSYEFMGSNRDLLGDTVRCKSMAF